MLLATERYVAGGEISNEKKTFNFDVILTVHRR